MPESVPVRKRAPVAMNNSPSASFPQLNPNPIVGVDSSGHVTFLNDGATRALESVGKGAAPDVFLPKDMDVILAALVGNRKGDRL